jgi:hypothetical protein
MSTPARAAARRPSPRPMPKASPEKAPKTRPNLEVVAPDRRRTLRLRLLGGVACLLLFGALLGLAIFHSVLVQGQLELDRMGEQIDAERELQRSLKKDYAALASPERIQAEATRLGMVLPDEREYLQAVVPGQSVPPPGAER